MQPNFNFLMFNSLERKKRNKPTPAQSQGLEDAFRKDTKPSREIKENLSVELGLDLSCVQIWFQNRRAKMKNAMRGHRPIRRPVPPKTSNGILIPPNRRRFQLPSIDFVRPPSQYVGSDPHLYHFSQTLSPVSSDDPSSH
ncbi:hypothetical protein DSO57_1007870 [Entomophthora muscae]|uniref:Uncharacterized protein n=1 Tax=Entomophthora muscae TaxID=34485 RepID=A0ACC2TUZ1_9FUNG|nr:hypothetical protein DSO57_1007870 [Entomophthora muscae]